MSEATCARWFAEAMESVRDLLDGATGHQEGAAEWTAERADEATRDEVVSFDAWRRLVEPVIVTQPNA